MTVRFRGRELTHPELGRNLIARFVDRVKEHGVAGTDAAARRQVDAHHDGIAAQAEEHTTHRRREAPRRANRRPKPRRRRTEHAGDRAEADRTAATKPVAADTQPATVTEPKPKTEPKTQPEPAPLPAEAPVAADVRPPAAAAPVATRVAETRSEPKQSTPAPEPVTSGE